MPKPKGGRGYTGVGTTHIRVPLPIKDKVRALVDEFYEEDSKQPVNTLPTFEEATVLAQNILASKKSARASLSKLLEAIYSKKIEL